MELHDDDPDHFEGVLKFIYTQDYDPATIPSNSNALQKIQFMLGLYKVADKYNVFRLPELTRYLPPPSSLEYRQRFHNPHHRCHNVLRVLFCTYTRCG